MRGPAVLVAFASQSGSTAAIAALIADELQAAGFAVDCRPASDVSSLAPYGAIVLGSGLYVRSRSSDGGGFLARHAGCGVRMPVWLYCAGPIGRGHALDVDASAECTVMDVARGVGARGAAAFGTLGTGAGGDAGSALDARGVRAWAREIASALGQRPLAAAS